MISSLCLLICRDRMMSSKPKLIDKSLEYRAYKVTLIHFRGMDQQVMVGNHLHLS